MSEKPYRTDPWPPGVPKPGSVAWPDGATRWLDDAFPEDRWRLRVLTGQPWMMTITLAARLRADIEALREQYRLTARTWSRLLPPETARALMAATTKEARRLQGQLEYVLALEKALSPSGPEPQAEAEEGGIVSAAP